MGSLVSIRWRTARKKDDEQLEHQMTEGMGTNSKQENWWGGFTCIWIDCFLKTHNLLSKWELKDNPTHKSQSRLWKLLLKDLEIFSYRHYQLHTNTQTHNYSPLLISMGKLIFRILKHPHTPTQTHSCNLERSEGTMAGAWIWSCL